MAQLTYYVAPWDQKPELPAEPARREVLHGYSVDDIDRATRYVISIDRWYRASDVRDRMGAVWSAIAEHLCLADEAPTWHDLVKVGMAASDRCVKEDMQFRGYATQDVQAGAGASPGFQRYWFTGNTPSHEDRIIDRVAADQIWLRLTKREQEALHALAVAGDTHLAAAALGISVDGAEKRIAAARAHFLERWHYPDPPSRPWRAKKHSAPRPRMYRGKTRLTESQVDALRARYNDGERLRALAAEARVGVSTLSALFLGKRRPAPDGDATSNKTRLEVS